jgi:predicted RNA binding protein YcfA (HicA-like mRNA interferase family)
LKHSISRRELIDKFHQLGFDGPFSGGKHQFLIKGEMKIRIPNPHKSKDIHISLLIEILRQAGIDKNEFDKL